MPVLKNQKHELYCQALVKGLTQTQAYINAGFSAKSAESAASRLAKDVRVKARIVELQALIVKVGETDLTNAEIAVLAEPIPFVRALVADRQYRLTVLQEFVTLLRGQTTDSEGRIRPAVIREARECLKQAAIESGQWDEKQLHPVDPGPDLSHLTTEQLFEEQRILRETMERIEAVRSGWPVPRMLEAGAGTVEEVKG